MTIITTYMTGYSSSVDCTMRNGNETLVGARMASVTSYLTYMHFAAVVDCLQWSFLSMWVEAADFLMHYGKT